MRITIPIGIGEAFDRVSILSIKLELITAAEKLENIQKEYQSIHEALLKINPEYEQTKEYQELKAINRQLWDIENTMRRYEKMNYFRIDFIETARKVYKKNDIRAKIKRVINRAYNSDFVEEKSHESVNNA